MWRGEGGRGEERRDRKMSQEGKEGQGKMRAEGGEGEGKESGSGGAVVDEITFTNTTAKW